MPISQRFAVRHGALRQLKADATFGIHWILIHNGCASEQTPMRHSMRHKLYVNRCRIQAQHLLMPPGSGAHAVSTASLGDAGCRGFTTAVAALQSTCQTDHCWKWSDITPEVLHWCLPGMMLMAIIAVWTPTGLPNLVASYLMPWQVLTGNSLHGYGLPGVLTNLGS